MTWQTTTWTKDMPSSYILQVAGILSMVCFYILMCYVLQLMQEFEKYQEVIQRPSIQRVLVAEREMLLSHLQDYVASVQVEAPESHLRLVDMPVLVARLSWVRQLEAKVICNIVYVVFEQSFIFSKISKKISLLISHYWVNWYKTTFSSSYRK